MTRPKRICAEPGCPVLVSKGYCLRHNRNRRAREKRESSTERTYDQRWRKLRKMVLARDPICQICGEAASTQVDHIIPRRPDQHAADVTEEELQALCASCHSRKTRAENVPNWDYGNASWQTDVEVDVEHPKRKRKITMPTKTPTSSLNMLAENAGATPTA